MKKRNQRRKSLGMALSQILILLISTVAISYALGAQIGFVSAAPTAGTSLASLKIGATFNFQGYSYKIVSATHIYRNDGANYYYNGVDCQQSSTEPTWTGWFYSPENSKSLTPAEKSSQSTNYCMTSDFLIAAEGAKLGFNQLCTVGQSDCETGLKCAELKSSGSAGGQNVCLWAEGQSCITDTTGNSCASGYCQYVATNSGNDQYLCEPSTTSTTTQTSTATVGFDGNCNSTKGSSNCEPGLQCAISPSSGAVTKPICLYGLDHSCTDLSGKNCASGVCQYSSESYTPVCTPSQANQVTAQSTPTSTPNPASGLSIGTLATAEELAGLSSTTVGITNMVNSCAQFISDATLGQLISCLQNAKKLAALQTSKQCVQITGPCTGPKDTSCCLKTPDGNPMSCQLKPGTKAEYTCQEGSTTDSVTYSKTKEAQIASQCREDNYDGWGNPTRCTEAESGQAMTCTVQGDCGIGYNCSKLQAGSPGTCVLKSGVGVTFNSASYISQTFGISNTDATAIYNECTKNWKSDGFVSLNYCVSELAGSSKANTKCTGNNPPSTFSCAGGNEKCVAGFAICPVESSNVKFSSYSEWVACNLQNKGASKPTDCGAEPTTTQADWQTCMDLRNKDTSICGPEPPATPTATTYSGTQAGLPASLLSKIPGIGSWFKTGVGFAVGHVIQGATTGAAAWAGLALLEQKLGWNNNQYLSAIPAAIGIGYAAGETALGISGAIGGKSKKAVAARSWGIGIGVGITAAVLVYLLANTQHVQKVVMFTCVPWQAPTGGSDCSKCGEDGLGCSQYQCQSLGQGCQILNQGQAGKEVCAWVNPKDTTPPTMQFWDILSNDYTYKPSTAVTPPATGVRINYTKSSNGAVQAYTPLTLGVQTNKPARCRMDLSNKDSYSQMQFLVDSGIFEYNHTINLAVPSLNESQMAQIAPGGTMNVYVRCKDANNNTDVASFVMQFDVQQGPDTQPPLIEGTNLGNNVPVYSGIDNTSVSLFVQDASGIAGCRWSHTDTAYGSMPNSSSLDCSNAINPNTGYYTCDGNLTGINDNSKNMFYFRCNDTKGNVDQSSYVLDLIGTQPLVITSASPNGTTIADSTNSVEIPITVKTAGGYNQGEATCYGKLNTTGDSGYTAFSSTDSYVSTTNLWLSGNPEMQYTYNIKCVDLGGNADYTNLTFSVETDKTAPQIVRVYKDNSNLVVVTDENATCKFDTVDCTYPFSGGTAMTNFMGTIHLTPWVASRTYYIKCEDVFGNRPAQNDCSATVAPSSI